MCAIHFESHNSFASCLYTLKDIIASSFLSSFFLLMFISAKNALDALFMCLWRLCLRDWRLYTQDKVTSIYILSPLCHSFYLLTSGRHLIVKSSVLPSGKDSFWLFQCNSNKPGVAEYETIFNTSRRFWKNVHDYASSAFEASEILHLTSSKLGLF